MRYGDMMATALTTAFCVWVTLEWRTNSFSEAIACLALMLLGGAVIFGLDKAFGAVADFAERKGWFDD